MTAPLTRLRTPGLGRALVVVVAGLAGAVAAPASLRAGHGLSEVRPQQVTEVQVARGHGLAVLPAASRVSSLLGAPRPQLPPPDVPSGLARWPVVLPPYGAPTARSLPLPRVSATERASPWPVSARGPPPPQLS